MTLQEIVFALERFWSERGCLIHQPWDAEVGAGTKHPETFFRVLGPRPWKVGYVQPSRRPADGRYGKNPNRTQQFHQFQVILKPSPLDIQDLYLESLRALGTEPLQGEKLYEELLGAQESLEPSGMEKINRLQRNHPVDAAVLEEQLEALRRCLTEGDQAGSLCPCGMVPVLQQLVPTYTPESGTAGMCGHQRGTGN